MMFKKFLYWYFSLNPLNSYKLPTGTVIDEQGEPVPEPEPVLEAPVGTYRIVPGTRGRDKKFAFYVERYVADYRYSNKRKFHWDYISETGYSGNALFFDSEILAEAWIAEILNYDENLKKHLAIPKRIVPPFTENLTPQQVLEIRKLEQSK